MASVNRVELMKRQLDATLQSLDDSAPAEAVETRALAPPTTPAPDLLRTATRLVVGSLLLAADALAMRAQIWEQLAQGDAGAPPTTDGAPGAPPTTDGAPDAPPAPEPGEEPDGASALPVPVTPNDSQIVLAAIGWLAAIPEQLGANGDPRHALEAARVQLEGTLGAIARGSLVMASRGQLGPPTMLDDPDLRRWISLGQIEAQRSRTLASVAIISIVREAVAYLASEPAVQQIVQEQGTTLATDVLGEVREYTVSSDTFVDGLVRRFFGRRARASAPEEAPPHVVTPALEES